MPVGSIGRGRARRGQLLESLLRVDPLDGRDFFPGPAGLQPPGQHIVFELHVEDLRQPILQRVIEDGDHRLDAAIEVTRHQV